MTSRLIIILIMSALAVAVYGRNDWYDEPVTVTAGLTVIDEIDISPKTAQVHVRIACDPSHTTSWGVVWDRRDSLNYMAAILTVPHDDRYTGVYEEYASISVVEVCDGVQTVIHSSPKLDCIDTKGEFNSLKLVSADGKTRLIVGADEPQEICVIPSGVGTGQMAIYSDSDVRCQRISAETSVDESVPRSRYTTVEAAAASIAQSIDPMEGAWEYMDRDSDADKAQIGGRYRLLTIRQDDRYDIIYVSGATVNSDRWRPLTIKGHLYKTIFKGNYDMVWYAADGTEIDEDTNAQLSDDGATLTLRFPTLDTEIRLRRLVLR